MEMLTVREVADLKGCTCRNVQDLAKKEILKGEMLLNSKNKPTWVFPVALLDAPLQRKYYAQLRKQSSASVLPQRKVATPLDLYTADEREEISFWTQTIERWQSYRNAPTVESKAEIDDRFVVAMKLEHPELAMSVDTLYRRWKAIKENDLDGLTDKRGKWKKGKSSIQQPMWDAFLYYFLDEAQHPVTKCYQYMTDAIREEYPELYDQIPHDSSFRRRIVSDLPVQLQILGRKGEKAYRDACGFYIRREYDEMQSNEYWIGDTHTLDIQSQDGDGNVHRLYLSAFLDARSGIMTGWHISATPSSQTTLLALRDGLTRRNAVPENIYVDNGREFLTHDIGGLGHRAKKPKNDKDRYDPPPVFARLGIKMTNAIVKNARAKTIERRFRDFKDQISRLFATFTGGSIAERPECLKARIKDGNIVVDAQLLEDINLIIEYYFNYEAYGGSVKSDHGRSKIEVYNAHFASTRKIPNADEMNLLLMRSSRVQTVGRRGVHLDINGDRLDYWSDDFRQALFGEKVYCRYDPYDLSSMRIYDLDDRYVMSVPCTDDTVLKYGAGQEEIKAAQRIIRSSERGDKDKLLAIRSLGYKTARELVLERAIQNSRNPVNPADPKVVELVRAVEQPLFKEAVGFASLDTINKNAMRKQGGNSDE